MVMCPETLCQGNDFLITGWWDKSQWHVYGDCECKVWFNSLWNVLTNKITIIIVIRIIIIYFNKLLFDYKL